VNAAVALRRTGCVVEPGLSDADVGRVSNLYIMFYQHTALIQRCADFAPKQRDATYAIRSVLTNCVLRQAVAYYAIQFDRV